MKSKIPLAWLQLAREKTHLLVALGGIAFADILIFQYTLVTNATLLPVTMTVNRALMVLVLTILMCVISGAIAVNKLRAVEPADIF